MSEPRVTITLGRSGQKVVKRAGTRSSGVHSNSSSISGSKQSIRDRLGSNVNGSSSSNKRRRSLRDDGRLDDARVGQSDLRVKLTRKRQCRQQANIHDDEHKRMVWRERQFRTERPLSRSDILGQMSPTKESTLFTRRAHIIGSSGNFLARQPPRESLSSWPVNGLRHRSPDRFFTTSRDLSPPKPVGNLRHVASVRPSDASRNGRYLSNDYSYPSRPAGPGLTPITMKDGSGYAKPIAHAQPTHTSSLVQKSTHTVDEPLTVAGLLNSLGLGKYAILFQAEEVDMTALKQMGDNDLKELGIPMGPRKKIILALMPRSKRQPP